MQSHYKAVTGPPGIPSTKLLTFPIRVYQSPPARQPEALPLVLADTGPQEGSGAYRGG